jgi:hypothetical protein
MLNLRKHVKEEINDHNLDYYFLMGGELEAVDWRTSTPRQFIKRIEQYVKKRLA